MPGAVPEGRKSSQDRKVNPKKKEKREEKEKEEENGRRISTGGNVFTREKKIYIHTRYNAERGNMYGAFTKSGYGVREGEGA